MAYFIGAVNVNNVLAQQADKPMMITANAITASAVVAWRSSGSFASGVDETAAGFAASRVFDGFHHLQTKPTTLADPVYLLIDMSASAGSFDCVALIGHNFGEMATPVTVTMQIADDSAFTSSLRDVATKVDVLGKRAVWYSLGIPAGGSFESYSGVQYARLKIAGHDRVPAVGQLILGSRHQMSQRPDQPYDDAETHSDTVDFISQGGAVSRYARNVGRREFRPTWSPAGVDAFSLDDLATLRAWFAATAQGSKPFVYIDKPESEKEATGITRTAHYVLAQPSLTMPLEGPVLRKGSFVFVETSPFVLGES